MSIEVKNLIKNSSQVFLATFAGGLILLVANLLLAKRFGPQEFGNFKTVINLFCFLPAVVDFGVKTTLVKFIAEFSDARINILIRRLLRLRIAIYLFLAVIFFILRDKISLYFLKDQSLSYLVTAGIILFILFFFDVFRFIVQGLENFRLYAVSQFLTLSSIGILTIVLGYNFGVVYAIIGWGVGYFVGNSINISFIIRRGLFKKTPQELDVKKLLFSYGLPLHFVMLPGFLGLAVVPVLSPFFSQRLIGYLAFSMIFYQGAISIPMAFFAVLFPKFSKLSKEPEKARASLEKAFVLYLPIVILGAVGTVLISRLFIELVASEYLPGLLIFRILICFGLISGFFLIYRSYLFGLAKLKHLAVVMIIQNFALILISFVVLRYFFE